jgi:Tfp pilus assembly protein PilF
MSLYDRVVVEDDTLEEANLQERFTGGAFIMVKRAYEALMSGDIKTAQRELESALVELRPKGRARYSVVTGRM